MDLNREVKGLSTDGCSRKREMFPMSLPCDIINCVVVGRSVRVSIDTVWIVFFSTLVIAMTVDDGFTLSDSINGWVAGFSIASTDVLGRFGSFSISSVPSVVVTVTGSFVFECSK